MQRLHIGLINNGRGTDGQTDEERIMKIKALLTASAVLAATAMVAAAPASAGPGGGYGKFMDRADRQASRIKQGVRSGELTRREFRKLKRQNNRVRRLIRSSKFNDGYIDRFERKEIKYALRNASDRIFNKKHNYKTQHSGRKYFGRNKYDRFGKKNIYGGKKGFKSHGRDKEVRRGRKSGGWLKIGKYY